MKILVVDYNEMDFTKVKNIYPCETLKILNVNTEGQILDKINKEPDISLVIINEVVSGIMKRYSTFKEIRKINKNIPIVSLTFA